MKLPTPPAERTILCLRRRSSTVMPAVTSVSPDDRVSAKRGQHSGYYDDNTRTIEIKYRGRAIPSKTAIDMRKKCFSSSSVQWFDQR